MTDVIGEIADDARRLGPGAIVLVVGPSGAGKDTLLRLAKAHFAANPAVSFPRRLITRGPDSHEDHDSIDSAELRAKVAQGDVALTWSAHGLEYAVPCSVDDAVAAGQVVVVNVSRKIIAAALQKYARVVVVFVTAPAEVLAERLAKRGREAAEDVAERLGRNMSEPLPHAPDLVVIQNVGAPEAVAQALINVIDRLA